MVFLSGVELGGAVALLSERCQCLLNRPVCVAPDRADRRTAHVALNVDTSLSMIFLVLRRTEVDDGGGLFAWPLLT